MTIILSRPSVAIPVTYRVLRSRRWRGIKMDSEWASYNQAAARAFEIKSERARPSAVTIVIHPYEL